MILILDVNALTLRLGAEVRDDVIETTGIAAAGDAQNVLLFRAGAKGLKAVTLGDVYRIEHLDMSAVEWVQGQPVIQYRDELMTLVGVEGIAGVRTEGRQHVLVFVQGERKVGLTIDQLEDIVTAEVRLSRSSSKPGILGSQIVSGRSVDFLDPLHFLSSTDQDTGLVQIGEAA